MNEINDFLSQYKGQYKFISPYHKTKKYLPFTIAGHSYNSEFPIQVNTIQYRGWSKENVSSGYTIQSLLEKINSKFLIKEKSN